MPDELAGLIGPLAGLVSGDTRGAGGRAAGAAGEFSQKALDELRRQFESAEGLITPFVASGLGALPGVVQGTTAQGLDERLAEIFNTDIFGTLAGERATALEGQLAAGGLTRSGTAIQEAANIPTSLGLDLENLLTGRATNLATAGQNAALGFGQIGGANAANIATVLGGQGRDVSSGILTDAQARATRGEQIGNLVTTAAGIFFSDPALKENVERISHVGDLILYQWDWIEAAKDTLIEQCSNIGFMADEVKEKYPQHVGEFGGFMVIDYPSLLDELEGSWLH